MLYPPSMLLLAKMQFKKRKNRRWWVCPVNYPQETQEIYNNLFRKLKITDHEEFFNYTWMLYECTTISVHLWFDKTIFK